MTRLAVSHCLVLIPGLVLIPAATTLTLAARPNIVLVMADDF